MNILIINKKILFLLLIPLFYYSCGKHVPNVPIYVNMNGFQNEDYADDFKDKLETKLKRHGFEIVNNNTAPYQLIVYDFYYYEYTFEEDAPYDDCDYSSYTLSAYRYGLEVGLVYKDTKVLKTWESSRTKEDELKEDETFSDCTSYKVDSPILQGGAFFRQRAIDIARATSTIVAKDY